jgi:hypothetical protein
MNTWLPPVHERASFRKGEAAPSGQALLYGSFLYLKEKSIFGTIKSFKTLVEEEERFSQCLYPIVFQCYPFSDQIFLKEVTKKIKQLGGTAARSFISRSHNSKVAL